MMVVGVGGCLFVGVGGVHGEVLPLGLLRGLLGVVSHQRQLHGGRMPLVVDVIVDGAVALEKQSEG